MIEKKQALTPQETELLYRFKPPVQQISSAIFFDIETTGLSWKNSFSPLIGCIYCENNNWFFHQWFAENYNEEKKILEEFLKIASDRTCFIQYNGTKFDIPYLQHKFTQHQLADCFWGNTYIDLYKEFLPLKNIIGVASMKQKDLEIYLNLFRKDIYSGKEWIQLYQKYLNTTSNALMEALLLHNKEDVFGMLMLLQLYAYPAFLEGKCTYASSCILKSQNRTNQPYDELLIELNLELPIPTPLSLRFEDSYITADKTKGKIKTKIIDKTVKLYYADYKNYIYLPLEDTAIHKSVGIYVDKKYRSIASPQNCYQKIPCDTQLLNEPIKIMIYAESVLRQILVSQ